MSDVRMTADIPGRGTIQIVIRAPEWGDTLRQGRRQFSGETEAGTPYRQDGGVEREFYDPTFTNLNLCERADLEAFFGQDGVNRREHPFTLEIINNTSLGFAIGTAQGLSSLDGLSTTQVTIPVTASFGLVRLDQSDVAFTPIPRGRYTTSLRFRSEKPPSC